LEWIIAGDWLFAGMIYRLQVQPYQRPFRQPLQTHHGHWDIREGLWVGLERSDGFIGWGEVAPIPWFGTETLAAAVAFLTSLPPTLSAQDLWTVPNTLPCCQFGLGSAYQSATGDSPLFIAGTVPLSFCGLLPTGAAALEAWPTLWQRGHHTLKWKIAVQPVAIELDLFQQLTTMLPSGATLRLDANGGLTVAEAQQWLTHLDQPHPITIEYLEQPLPPAEFTAMVQLSQMFTTPLALDESVATLAQLEQCYQQGWPSVMVIKPTITGYPQRLSQFLKNYPIDAVFSSAFETEVGRSTALSLAQSFNSPQRALGFSVNPWFLETADEFGVEPQ
jgi:O-succinylbenzoate synthase